MEIIFATNNAHKLEEVRSVLGAKFKVLSLSDIGCNVEVEETSDTFEGNALLKAQYVFEHYNRPCFSDDSGLEVDALFNAPGVYSARYGGEHGNHEKNMDKLLNSLMGQSNRKARFRTVLCYLNEVGEVHYFNGVVNGIILSKKQGAAGFGYDPLFMPHGHNRTFAQMTPEAKNKISHRALAVNELLNFLQP